MSKIELLIAGSEESVMATGDLRIILCVCAYRWWWWGYLYSFRYRCRYIHIFKREDLMVLSDFFSTKNNYCSLSEYSSSTLMQPRFLFASWMIFLNPSGVSNSWLLQNFKIIFLRSYLFRERKHMNGVGRDRERSRKSEADSMLSMELDLGLDLTTLRSWTELKPRVGCLTDRAIQVPRYFQ